MTDTPKARPVVADTPRETVEVGGQEAAVLTVDMLRKAMEQVESEGRKAHGTVENPHIVHPNGGICIECGSFFTTFALDAEGADDPPPATSHASDSPRG
jgi:hypothetical protein